MVLWTHKTQRRERAKSEVSFKSNESFISNKTRGLWELMGSKNLKQFVQIKRILYP